MDFKKDVNNQYLAEVNQPLSAQEPEHPVQAKTHEFTFSIPELKLQAYPSPLMKLLLIHIFYK